MSLSVPSQIPLSTLFMLILAFTISLLMTVANRLLSNPVQTKAWRKETMEWNTELRKAQKAGDKKTVDKLMKKQKQILQIQSKMTWNSMKVTLLFFIPLIIVWQFLGAALGAHPVAYFPGIGPNLPTPGGIFGASFLWWYLLCSMTFGTVFSHLFKLIEVE